MKSMAAAVGDLACRIYDMDPCIGAASRRSLGVGVIVACILLLTAILLAGLAIRR